MINSRSVSLVEVLQLGHFYPANVQREFQWKTTHTQQLFEDIFSAFQHTGADPGEADYLTDGDIEDESSDHSSEEPSGASIDGSKITKARVKSRARRTPDQYFLGSIIILKSPRAQERYFIYDGLQRLTTIAILLSKLRDSWHTPNAAENDQIFAMLIDEDLKPRIRVPTSGQTLIDIIKTRRFQQRQLTEGDLRMREASIDFAKEFRNWTDERRKAFLKFFSNNVKLTITEVNSPSLAYQIFVAANTRGLSLSIGDILKGQLVEQVAQAGGTYKQIISTSDYWRWGQRKLRNGFNDFLCAVEILKFRPDSKDRHTPGELLIDLFSDGETAQEIAQWVSTEFSEMTDVFEKSRTHFTMDGVNGCNLSFRQLSFLGWKEWQPFYLALGLGLASATPEEWYKKISSLQRACFILELLDWSPRTRRRVFLEAMDQLERGLDPFAFRPAKGEFGQLRFSRKFKDIARQNLRIQLVSEEKRGAIVRWIETLHWGDVVPRFCTDDASVEHVLPQTPTGDWVSIFSDDERERLTNRLGNLCIIPKHLNKQIGNSGWIEKSSTYRTLGGRFKGVEFVVDAGDSFNDEDPALNWNPNVVEGLTEILASIAERALRIR